MILYTESDRNRKNALIEKSFSSFSSRDKKIFKTQWVDGNERKFKFYAKTRISDFALFMTWNDGFIHMWLVGWLIEMIVLNFDSPIICMNLSSCDIENLEHLVMNEVIKYVQLHINQSYLKENLKHIKPCMRYLIKISQREVKNT